MIIMKMKKQKLQKSKLRKGKLKFEDLKDCSEETQLENK